MGPSSVPSEVAEHRPHTQEADKLQRSYSDEITGVAVMNVDWALRGFHQLWAGVKVLEISGTKMCTVCSSFPSTSFSTKSVGKLSALSILGGL